MLVSSNNHGFGCGTSEEIDDAQPLCCFEKQEWLGVVEYDLSVMGVQWTVQKAHQSSNKACVYSSWVATSSGSMWFVWRGPVWWPCVQMLANSW